MRSIGGDIIGKIRSKRIEKYGRTWDSTLECSYYEYLLGLQKSGQVLEIVLQPKIVLIEKFEKYGKKFRQSTYSPDFLVTYSDNSREYIDVKGFSTQQGELRRKLYDSKFPDTLRWVTYSKKYSVTGWIDWDELEKIRKDNRKKKKEEANV